MDLLPHSPDQFGGIIVDSDGLPPDATFGQTLQSSLAAWRSDGRRLVWLKVPIERAALVPMAVEQGFFFHHSNEGDLMMVARLVEGAFVPTHATHYIGVGGVCINDRQALRIVRAALSSPGVMPEWIDGYADPSRYEFFMPSDVQSEE